MCRVLSVMPVVLCLSISLTGCDGITEPPREIPRRAGTAEGWGVGLWNSVAAIAIAVGGDISSAKEGRATRPTVVLRAPKIAAVNEIIKVEATYRVQGKVVPEWWVLHPYGATIRREKDGELMKSEFGAHAGEGRLIVTFKADEPGNYVMEIKTWAAGADTATEKPMAAARRTVTVR
jgi:hypothetical protein